MVVDELVALLGYDIKNEGELKKFNKSLDTLEKKCYAIGAALRTAVTVGAAAFAGATAFLGKSVIDTSAEFEKYNATLETIEGSSEKAATAMSWITDFAKTTPFEVTELTQAFVKLRSYGLDPMDGTMVALGDTASGMGKSLNQAVEALADAATGEFERIKEFGVKAKTAGEQVTFTWVENGKELTKTVKKNGIEISKTLKEIWGKRFTGAMIRQSKTWNGVISNLSDRWTGFKKAIGDAGFFDNAKRKLGELMDELDDWESSGGLKELASSLSSGFSTILDGIAAVAKQTVAHLKFLKENFAALKPYIYTMIGAFLLLLALTRPIAFAFLAIGWAVDDFLTHLEGGDSVFGRFKQWLKDLVPGTEEIKEMFANMGLAVTAGLAAAFLLAPMSIGKGLLAAIRLAIVGAGLLSPPMWGVILAGAAAALVAYFWDDIVALWDTLDFASLGIKIGVGIVDGVKSMAAAVAAAVASIIPSPEMLLPGGLPTPAAVERMQQQIRNGAGAAGGAIAGDAIRNNTNNTTVTAPITVNVKNAVESGQAVGNIVQDGVNKGAQPSRMQKSGPR